MLAANQNLLACSIVLFLFSGLFDHDLYRYYLLLPIIVGCIYSKEQDQFNLIKKYYQFNIKILPKGVKIYNIITMFKSNKNIENIGIFTHHPNKAIVDLIKFNNYSILAIDNIDKKVFENIENNLENIVAVDEVLPRIIPFMSEADMFIRISNYAIIKPSELPITEILRKKVGNKFEYATKLTI